MIYRHTAEQIQAYFDRPAMNQSSLKVIIKSGIHAFLGNQEELLKDEDEKEYYKEEKRHFVIGKAVDCDITEGDEVFKGRYHISTLAKKPGKTALSVLKLAFDKAKEEFPNGIDIDLSLYKKQIYEACNDQEYYMNRKSKTDDHETDTRVAGLIDSLAKNYWSDLYLAEDKQILAEDEQMAINGILISLKTHKHTAHLFKDSKDIDIVYQFAMYWDYNDVECKGMIDIIIINHKLKKIFLIDLKTIGDYVTNFPNVLVNPRRYDLQASFYTYGFGQNLTQLATLIGKHLIGYEVAKFGFIAESSIRPGTPLVFVLDGKLLDLGMRGDKELGLLGWQQGIETYKEWAAVEFSIEKKYADTNGVVLLDTSIV